LTPLQIDCRHCEHRAPLGRRFFRRIPGDALHPARESAKSLANEITAPEDEITDDQAMIAYQEWAAIVERIERET
jgi:hypothetical protein